MENSLVYHAFRKPKRLKSGKKVYRWYYYWEDGDKQIQKACIGCRNRSEAESYIRNLPPPAGAALVIQKPEALIRDIAENMYIPGSAHASRRSQLGKSIDIETFKECRRFTKLIISLWGDMRLADLGVEAVMPYLFKDEHSGKWKNRFLEILGEIYSEAAWYNCRVIKPAYQRFAANSKKADIFSTAELDRLFRPENFPEEVYYLFFLLCLSAGMRLGEARAVRVKQIILDKQIIIIDGFCKRDGTRTTYNKKGSQDHPKIRIVYLSDFTIGKIAAWIKAQGLTNEDFCFTKEGAPIRQEHLETVFYRTLQKTGFIPLRAARVKAKYGTGRQKQIREHMRPADGRKLVIHSLRYTYVSRMRRELTAEELLPMTGHTSVEMVDYYNQRTLELALAALPSAGLAAANTLFA